MFDVSVKMTIVGDTGVGKTSFVSRLENPHRPIRKDHTMTIGVDHVPCIVTVSDPQPLRMKFQIWDTAGQERYATLTRGFYVGTELICLVYSCDNPDTLCSLSSRWWTELKAAPIDLSTAVVLIVGNKADKCVPEKSLAGPLGRLMDEIQKDTGGRPPVHMRVSALKDKSVAPVLQAVAWKCLQIPTVRSAARRSPSFRKGGPLVSLIAEPSPTSSSSGRSWCCR